MTAVVLVVGVTFLAIVVAVVFVAFVAVLVAQPLAPSLIHPLEQSSQICPPGVLVHLRLLSQPPFLVRHSSTSDEDDDNIIDIVREKAHVTASMRNCWCGKTVIVSTTFFSTPTSASHIGCCCAPSPCVHTPWFHPRTLIIPTVNLPELKFRNL